MTATEKTEFVEKPTGNDANPMRRSEWIGIAVCAGLYLLLRIVGLRAAVINDKLDEGVYLSLMQTVAAGKGALYRDLLLCHPPGVVWAGAWLWPQVHGSLFLLRLVYIVLCALAFIPIYAPARRFYGSQVALLTLLLLTTSPGLANWMGRGIYLDPLLNIPLYTAIWALTAFPARKRGIALGAGALLGMSYLLKETAVPAAFAICLALWASARFDVFAHTRSRLPASPPDVEHAVVGTNAEPTRNQDNSIDGRTWLWFGLGSTMTFVIVLAWLARIPNYWRDTFLLNARDVYQWGLRPHEFLTGFYALPLPLTVGVLGVLHMARQHRSRSERFLGLFTLLLTLIMVFVPKRFYWRYLTCVLPLYCLGAAAWWRHFLHSHPSQTKRRAAFAFVGLLGLVHVAGLALYRLYEEPNPPAYRTALRILRAEPGPLFTLDPVWAAASGHPLTPDVEGLLRADIFVPTSPEEYTSVLLQCPTVLLDREAMYWLPKETERILRRCYRTVFRFQSPNNKHYVEILERPPAPTKAAPRT